MRRVDIGTRSLIGGESSESSPDCLLNNPEELVFIGFVALSRLSQPVDFFDDLN